MVGRTARRPHGRQIRVASGYTAYVPEPRPPPTGWDASLVVRLSEADRAIGRLAGEGRRLRNPHLLIRPFVRREAVLSSRIEGTQATLGELLAAEAGAAVDRSPHDLREVANYLAVPKHGDVQSAEHTCRSPEEIRTLLLPLVQLRRVARRG
ncbi:MAG: hypothetical protein H0X65_21715 [Gemmatimonadetes bacterium]|nr:hypothetical protein [Gemmatimonadota bacterium]